MVSRVVAIIVSFEPDLAALGGLLDRLHGEVAESVIVDNGSSMNVAGFVSARGKPRESCLALGENLGIAAAQNRGIGMAQAAGADAVVLFDQDSLPPPGMVATLAEAIIALKAANMRPAAVGPTPVDARLPPRAGSHAASAAPVTVDHLIASGCLIPLAVLDAVGGMREDLFIDYVDIEWCLRAGAAGYHCYRLPSLAMAHEFGAPISVLGRSYASHGALRHYYLFRNSVWLWRQAAIPLGWRLKTAPRIALRLIFNLLFARPHRQQWSMMGQGLADGFAGRMGPWHPR